jgi:drug/metabolite transporter (DMT)-like permease
MTAEPNHTDPDHTDPEAPGPETSGRAAARQIALPPAPAEKAEISPEARGANPPTPRVPLPGLAAIALYLLLLAGTIVVGVAAGRRYPPVFLVFSALFFAACAGLLMLFRWAWALALAAVGLLAGYNFWIFSTRGIGPALVQGLLNLIFFFYLIRPEVREKLR